MESTWTNGCAERQDLQPIMEEEDKSLSKDSHSESSDTTSTVKHWDCRWTPSEAYDSSGTSSTSEQCDEQTHYSCPINYTVKSSRRSQCNTAANISHHANQSFCEAPCHSTQDLRSHECCNTNYGLRYHQQSHKTNLPKHIPRVNVTAASSMSNLTGRQTTGGSLDRRRRRLRNRNDRDQRARSQNDLCCDREMKTIPVHYCSLQQFHCQYASNPYINCHNNNTEERLRKLENERAGLHMEVSVLSEQVDAQSSKIIDLENQLQDKKDGLRQMEDLLQKEILLRSALETQKLELLTSLSELKLRQASLEHENLALRNATSIANGERFSRHAGQYSSLPRPPTTSKKGVAFAEEECTTINDTERIEAIAVKPLNELAMEDIEDWLARLGLEMYAPELRRWGATGPKLMDATAHQIEKELDIRNCLHRKKLLYAVESERSEGAGFLGSEKMDNSAVLRWLDDIGLPQHKDAFQKAKVDGRVLHRLTTEDLLALGITAQLHAASLRRGIQILRELNFNFDNLERRSLSGNGADGSNIALWTNHRVMEWLRVVDLAEYAPNMRGSGVHGGLMVHEGRFTSELLAALLSIPPSKTLLRRHLTTHFNEILGREVVQHKREMETTLGFIPLTLSARLKVPKKSQFTLKRKKSKSEIDYGNLVCPLEASLSGTSSTPTSTPSSPNLNSPTV